MEHCPDTRYRERCKAEGVEPKLLGSCPMRVYFNDLRADPCATDTAASSHMHAFLDLVLEWHSHPGTRISGYLVRTTPHTSFPRVWLCFPSARPFCLASVLIAGCIAPSHRCIQSHWSAAIQAHTFSACQSAHRRTAIISTRR